MKNKNKNTHIQVLGKLRAKLLVLAPLYLVLICVHIHTFLTWRHTISSPSIQSHCHALPIVCAIISLKKKITYLQHIKCRDLSL